jgi:26S proteasome regulatory subunit N10
MRNGDYLPSRIEAQNDCASTISNRRLNDNPESTVGLLSMAGKNVELLVPPTTDSGKVLAAMGQVKCGGQISFITSLKIALIALNHVKNKNGGRRIICFVGSPIEESTEELIKLAKKSLKKNNIGIDVVSIGENKANEEKLTAFIQEANTNDNSSLVMVTAGTDRALDEILMNPSLGLGQGTGFGGGAVGGGAGGEGGT